MVDDITKTPPMEGLIETFEDGNVLIFTFGKPLNGRLLFSSELELSRKEQPECIDLRKQTLSTLSQCAHTHGITRIAIPHVYQFNAGITTFEKVLGTLKESINGVDIHASDDEALRNDGVVLQRGEGTAIITGDCPTLVLYSSEKNAPIVAAHAGRNSLHEIIGHSHRGNSESVVYEAIKKLALPTGRIRARITAGISGDHYLHHNDHDKNSDRNRALTKHFSQLGAAGPDDPEGHIDLAKAITEQLKHMGVPEEHISLDGLDTYTDDRLWSHRIGEKGRNIILVLHR